MHTMTSVRCSKCVQAVGLRSVVLCSVCVGLRSVVQAVGLRSVVLCSDEIQRMEHGSDRNQVANAHHSEVEGEEATVAFDRALDARDACKARLRVRAVIQRRAT